MLYELVRLRSIVSRVRPYLCQVRKRAYIKFVGLVLILVVLATAEGYAQQGPLRIHAQISKHKKEVKLAFLGHRAAATMGVNQSVEPWAESLSACSSRYHSYSPLKRYIDFNKKFTDHFQLIYPFEAFW